jgi:hypothetical protein
MDIVGWGWIVNWWRRRESNPRPQALRPRLYMRIPSIDLTGRYPTSRENGRRSQLGFNGLALREPHRDPVRVDARNLNAQARLQSDGTLLGFKQRVRSCRRWQLLICSVINEATAPRHAPQVSKPASKPGRPLWNSFKINFKILLA